MVWVALGPILITGACSITVIVGDKGNASLEVPAFKACPGVQFEITITKDGKSSTATGTVAAGTLKFSVPKGVEITGLVDVKIRVLGDAACGPFPPGASKVAMGIYLAPRRDTQGQEVKDTYVIDVSEFK